MNITLDEAKALYSILQYEYLPREPHERYVQYMALMNRLYIFIHKEEEHDKPHL